MWDELRWLCFYVSDTCHCYKKIWKRIPPWENFHRSPWITHFVFKAITWATFVKFTAKCIYLLPFKNTCTWFVQAKMSGWGWMTRICQNELSLDWKRNKRDDGRFLSPPVSSFDTHQNERLIYLTHNPEQKVCTRLWSYSSFLLSHLASTSVLTLHWEHSDIEGNIKSSPICFCLPTASHRFLVETWQGSLSILTIFPLHLVSPFS